MPARESFTREFVADRELLQREVKDDVPGWLWSAASGTVLALYIVFLATLAWGVGRVARRGPQPPVAPDAEPRTEGAALRRRGAVGATT